MDIWSLFFLSSQGKSKYLPSCFYEKKFSLVYLHVWFFLARKIICLLLVQHEIEPIDHWINWLKHAQLYVVHMQCRAAGTYWDLRTGYYQILAGTLTLFQYCLEFVASYTKHSTSLGVCSSAVCTKFNLFRFRLVNMIVT